MATRTALSVALRRSTSRSASRSRKLAPPVRPTVIAPPVIAPKLPAPALRPTPGKLRLALARTGDHPAIHRQLVSVFHGPSAGEFHAQLDEPGYEPSDRLVIKDGEQIAAHLRLARQKIQLDGCAAPAARFMDLATATEYRGRGLATALLAAGEQAAREKGVLVALTRTRVPSLFGRQGWSVCGRHLFSAAAPRQVLAELDATSAGDKAAADAANLLVRPRPERVVVRPLRRIELPALARLYEQNLAGRCGWPVRSRDYWDWLLARGACDRIFVAATGPEPSELSALLDTIVGYAFVRQCRLVEVVSAAGRPEVARELAARVCADASEQGDWLVRCDAPPDHPLHSLFRNAGGRIVSEQQLDGELFMAKLLDPLALLRQLADGLTPRTKAAGITKPLRLGLELRSSGGRGTSGLVERYGLCLSPRSTRIETGTPCRHSLILRYGDLAPLLLADCSAKELIATGRLRATTRTARSVAQAMFPTARWWRPPLDDLLA